MKPNYMRAWTNMGISQVSEQITDVGFEDADHVPALLLEFTKSITNVQPGMMYNDSGIYKNPGADMWVKSLVPHAVLQEQRERELVE